MTNQSRRKFLKGISYGGILAVGGLTSVSHAFSVSTEKTASASKIIPNVNDGDIGHNGISIMQQQLDGRHVVTLMNNTDRTINLNGEQPISLEKANGSLIVKANTTLRDEGEIAILPSVRFTIDIEEVSANILNDSSPVKNVLQNHAMISSDHSLFNQLIPVNTVVS